MKQKLIVLLVLLLAIAMLFAACNFGTRGGKEEPGEEDGTPESSGLSYIIDKDNECAIISGRGSCQDMDIVIPKTIEGCPVTEIATDAFRGDKYLKSITIPNSVTSIGEYAFSTCPKLESIVIPNSVNTVGSAAFGACTGLTSVTIGNSVTSIGDSVFSGCTGLTSITIPGSVTSIGNGAFYGCNKLIEVRNLSNLSITAGSSSNGYVGYYAKHVYKEGESYLHTTADGFIFYENGDEVYLVAYTGNETELTLPANYNGKNYAINQYAFYRCTGLTSVTIPDGVTGIGNYAFRNCTGLTSITYQGTIDEWNAISKGSYWNYNTGSYIVHCTDGDITK